MIVYIRIVDWMFFWLIFRIIVSISFYARQQNVSRVLAIGWASVCPSVCHTLDLYQSGVSYNHEIFTVGCPKVWFSVTLFGALVCGSSPRTRASNRGTLSKKALFCCYWLV